MTELVTDPEGSIPLRSHHVG